MKPFHTILLVAVGMLVLTGCQKAEEAASPPETATTTLDTASPGGTTPVAPPELPGMSVAPALDVSRETTDPDGKTVSVIERLDLAVEYYNRSIANLTPQDEEQAKNFRPPPPLTDLQQLVQYRIIAAVPPAPPGQKYIYDAQAGKVKLIGQ